MSVTRDHAKLAESYAKGVVSGDVIAGPWVIAAAKRHLNDLEKSKKSDYPYAFDPARGARVCRFIELLPHVKGRWAAKAQNLELRPWQCFLIVVLFGWIRKRDGLRRFRIAYWCIPRKNGKSILGAGIGLYMFAADNEFGAEVYSGATTEKQAWEVFRPAKLMMERSHELREALGVEVWAKQLLTELDGSKFEPVIGNPGDGSSPSCAIVDEFHEHETPALYDTMETGMGAREQPLILIITTAGYNFAGPCHEKEAEVKKVLGGVIENDELFGVVFGIDEEKDDWTDPKSLIKANPNYNVSVDGEFLQARQRAAVINPIDQNKFKTKHLNIWCSVAKAWMPPNLWRACADKGLIEEDLINDPEVESWIAVDLASKTDLCSEQRLHRKYIHGKPHYYLFGRYWLPEEAIEEPGPNQAHYRKWVNMKLLTPTEGATVDFAAITEQVVADAKRINPKEVIYDPFNATQMSQALIGEGVKNVVEFVQQPQNFAVPMDEFISIVKDNRFHHDDNEMTNWCVSNVVARPTKKGLSAPIKEKIHLKIDGAVAAMMAVGRATAEEREKEFTMLVL